ncbi:MAG TPA: phage tail sheath C-terminal domain-containing protein [Allosphingosinicella sp.]
MTGVPTSICAFVGFAGEGPAEAPRQVFSWAEYEGLFGGLDGGELGYAVHGFFENGGGEAWIVRVAGEAAPDGLALTGDERAGTGLYALASVDLFNLLCLPDLRRLDGPAHLAAAEAAAAYCRARRAFLILDPPGAIATVEQAQAWIQTSAPALGSANTSYAAAYWPEPIIADPRAGAAPRRVAASGIMAGIYVSTDLERGVWKAPAGTSLAMAGVIDLAVRLNDAENALINPLGLNALRVFPVYGALPWGARTLQGADLLASDWKYVPVRRTALLIEESLRRGLAWSASEPNREPLWNLVRLQAGAFMNDLFRQGAFAGATPRDAYFVHCDATTTTQSDIDAGIVNLVVGFAPSRAAEFVVLQIQLSAAPPD